MAQALTLDAAIQGSRMDGWRDNPMKLKKVRLAIKAVIEQHRQGPTVDAMTDRLLELAKHQHEY